MQHDSFIKMKSCQINNKRNDTTCKETEVVHKVEMFQRKEM